ncbi:alpha/beta fold hydrolase [Fictibacillus gelatini]|uniref:alpha/beta fold hydrolase n=1 Tax=Fictibacillus gelatini TaxID=225985 RepID=UPI0003F78337|nr:alpha/beta fold hydrolase [Fictibacillus gelatini]
MVIIENENIHDIPVLHAVKSGNVNQPLPLVIFIHGFTSAKEHNLHFAYSLAEAGYRVILPDMNYHGERSSNLSMEQMYSSFWDIVVQGIYDVNAIITELDNRGWIENERIGLSGTSMGGIITYGTLTQNDNIKAAVSLMGSPSYERLAYWQFNEFKKQGVEFSFSDDQLLGAINNLKPYDITLQPEKLNRRPLLIWHSKIDSVVPFQYDEEFYLSVRNDYEQEGHIRFLVDHSSGHKVSRHAYLETVAWFKEHL